MKKNMFVGLLLCLLLFTMSTTTVSANSAAPIIGVTIMPDVCDEMAEESTFPGNFDILVRTQDFETSDFGSMTDKYKEFYPFFDDIEYLDNIPSGWTSFSAFYTDEREWGYSRYYCGMEFGDDEEVAQMKYLKVVYFDDEGNTISISESVKVPTVLFYQDMESIIYFNTATNEIEADLSPMTHPMVFIAMIGVFFLILFSVFTEIIVALFFGMKSSKEMISILLINTGTQLIMYIYFFAVFNGDGDYYIHLLVYEIFVLVVEFLFLNWRLKGLISTKKLAFFVVVANAVSYLLGALIFM